AVFWLNHRQSGGCPPPAAGGVPSGRECFVVMAAGAGGVSMSLTTAPGTMTGEEIVALTKRHTMFEWTAQSKADPIPVAGAKGCWFWTPEGKRYLDFNSQLMGTS